MKLTKLTDYIKFGKKYKNFQVFEVARTNPFYLIFLIENTKTTDFDDDTINRIYNQAKKLKSKHTAPELIMILSARGLKAIQNNVTMNKLLNKDVIENLKVGRNVLIVTNKSYNNFIKLPNNKNITIY